jgi:pimeloyl-ACP methyl ester carboxylesterase
VDPGLRGELDKIDTKVCPLYLMPGAYDFSCTPDDTMQTARRIPGAEMAVMNEVGHFPMSENPARFRRDIPPVLEDVRTAHG